MTITQIRAFYLAATLGSFTAAAEYMGLTQPTVSELVRKVEDRYGMALFVRRGRRLVLTTAGQALMPWAKRLLDAELGIVSDRLELVRSPALLYQALGGGAE